MDLKNKNEKKIKVRIAGGYGGRNDIDWLSQGSIKFEIVKSVDEAQLLVLTGGADINPEIYNEKKNRKTYINEYRDKDELADLKRAIDLKIPIIGICRGAQMICGVAGGKLVQHVVGHGGANHAMEILLGRDRGSYFTINSLHHQMMMPFNLPKSDYDLIAKSRYALSNTYENTSVEDQYDMSMEPEVIYFKKINAYAIQCHPEMMSRVDSNYLDVLNFFRYSIYSYFKELFIQPTSNEAKAQTKENEIENDIKVRPYTTTGYADGKGNFRWVDANTVENIDNGIVGNTRYGKDILIDKPGMDPPTIKDYEGVLKSVVEFEIP